MRTRVRSARPLAALASAAATVTLVLSSCTGGITGGAGSSDDGGSSDAGGASGNGQEAKTPPLAELGESAAQHLDSDPATDPAYASYYEQSIDWSDCGDDSGVDRQCGTVTVPRVWNDPGAGDIEIAVAKVAATGEKKGSLFLNPGGPGGSGVEFASTVATYIAGEPVTSSFDLVGFDPRGVSRSSGIHCVSDEEFDAEYNKPGDPDATPDENLQTTIDWMQKLADGCSEKYEDLLPYLDTYSAARDLDVLRAAVDSDTLDYAGFSYGTYLGATYADLYPERVGRFVLDGAMDPALTMDQITAGQTAGFEAAIEDFLQDCLSRGDDACPFKGDVAEAKTQLENLLTSWDRNPVETDDPDGRRMTGSHASTALVMAMYEDAIWEMLRSGLADATQGDGSMLLQLSDMSAEREQGGTFNGNGAFAINAINCLDHPGVADLQWQKQQSEELAQKYPLMGENAGYSAAYCKPWPVKPLREPAPIAAKGTGPILVIGTTGDPATPYAWSESLAQQLDQGVLLTYEGRGHTAYGRSGGCIEKAVEDYLVEGTVPENGLTCSSPGGDEQAG